jgi:predicted O-methyltransferase YrrM
MTPSIRAFEHGVRDPEITAGTIDVIDRLSADRSLDAYRESLRGIARDRRPYWDLACALSYLAECFPIEDYLEIGVRRGKSMAQVASRRPDCRIVGCDMWMSPYGGVDNPGPTFVQDEMTRLGHRGSLELISGSSHDVLPAFKAQRPRERFDVVTVDGDHSDEGAWADLVEAVDLVRPGGFLVFDDITHPLHTLASVWARFRQSYGGTFEFAENLADHKGTGVARRRDLADVLRARPAA